MLRSEGLPLALQVIRRPWPCPLDASSNLLDYWTLGKTNAPEGQACVAPVEGGDRGPVAMFPVAGAAPGTE